MLSKPLLIKFGDNDFYNTFIPLLNALDTSSKYNNHSREYLLHIINECIKNTNYRIYTNNKYSEVYYKDQKISSKENSTTMIDPKTIQLTDDEIRTLLVLEAVASPGACVTDDELRRHPKHLWERKTMVALCEEVLRLRAENERLLAAASTFTVDLGSLPKEQKRRIKELKNRIIHSSVPGTAMYKTIDYLIEAENVIEWIDELLNYEDCQISEFSSRCCEHGTKSCEVQHKSIDNTNE